MESTNSAIDYPIQYSDEIDAEKILVSHRNTPMILIGNFLATVPLAIVLWESDYSTEIISWLILLYIPLFIRSIHYGRFDTLTASYSDISRYGHEQVMLVFLTGCAWGVAGILFFDANEIKNMSFLILTFVSMIAGSLVSLSSRPFSYMMFSTPLMAPLIVNMLLQDQWFYSWMGFGATVYLIATFGFSRTIHRVIDKSLRLKYENFDLIEDLRQETDRANKANEEKSRFLASASHDLRQPLHAVNLFTEVLSKKMTTSEQQIDLENIHQGLESLNELLDALFDVSRLDAEKGMAVNKLSFNIDDIFRKLECQFLIEAKIKGLGFSIKFHNYIVFSDPVLLERVITNLLVNAIKYTNHGTVAVFFEQVDDDLVKVCISDTGVGISDLDAEYIFQEFFQVHNQERDRKYGLGLGLAIVRRALDLLGHDIEVRSTLGRGTDFIITLPISHEVAELPVVVSEKQDGQGGFDGLSIMIVDNEVNIVKAMESLLVSWGSGCMSFSSTENALSAIHDGVKPDFLIVDYRMPGKYSGSLFVSEVRKVLKHLPALIITGDTSDEVVNEFRLNNLDYLHKPIKPPQLRMMISRVLRKYPTSLSES